VHADGGRRVTGRVVVPGVGEGTPVFVVAGPGVPYGLGELVELYGPAVREPGEVVGGGLVRGAGLHDRDAHVAVSVAGLMVTQGGFA
jgi:hypothetical protein